MVQVGSVESHTPSIFDVALAPVEQLAYLRDVKMYVDMSSSAAVGSVVQAMHKIGGAYKKTPTSAFLVTTSGYTIALDADAKIGNITMDGIVYPVSEAPPATGRALKVEEQMPMVVTMTGRELVKHQEKRRLSLFGGALLTSGTFTTMASTGLLRRSLEENGRELSLFGGALLTSGTFTMMASTGFV